MGRPRIKKPKAKESKKPVAVAPKKKPALHELKEARYKARCKKFAPKSPEAIARAKTEKKKAKPAKKGSKGKEVKKKSNPIVHDHPAIFVARPKNFGLAQDLPPTSDLTRFVRWPRYIKRQRQKAILMRRLKVPPAVNQFRMVLDRVTRKAVWRLIKKYKPENEVEKKIRLKKIAKAKLKDPKAPPLAKRLTVHSGIQQVTRLIETQRAKLVVIANDVEPLELVVWMPTLCKKLEVPFCIAKDRAAMGRLTGVKKTTCIAITDIRAEDKPALQNILQAVNIKYGDKFDDYRKKWGGLALGKKHDRIMELRANAAAAAAGRSKTK